MKKNTKEYAWEYVKDVKNISWSNAQVYMVKLVPDKSLEIPQKYLGKLNRHLLNLNGNYAVRVTFNTEMDGLLGPETLYSNPITKQIIGLDFRF